MSEQNITIQTDDRGVTTVTMNRPEKHNAFNAEVIAELTAAFQQVENDPNSRIMILAAEGKSFSAGADLNWMKSMAGYTYEENLRDAGGLAGMLKTLNFLSKPTIARVQGASFGGAVGLVSCCDMAVGSPRASFCLSEVKIGLTPATISPYVVAALGYRASRRYFITAERFGAEKALELGLLSEVVEEDQLDATVDQLVESLLTNSPQAVGAAKRLVRDVAFREVTDELIADTSERIASIRTSEEGQEGLTAFLEKRSPSWLKGKE